MQSRSSVKESPARTIVVLKPDTEISSVRRNRKPQWGFIKTIVVVSVILYTVILVAPLLLSFVYSFTNLNPLFPTTKFVGLRNYTDLAKDTDFLNALARTLLLSINVTLIANIAGLFVALLLNRNNRF